LILSGFALIGSIRSWGVRFPFLERVGRRGRGHFPFLARWLAGTNEQTFPR
jgi:hypothetical protein